MIDVVGQKLGRENDSDVILLFSMSLWSVACLAWHSIMEMNVGKEYSTARTSVMIEAMTIFPRAIIR